ncbi:unnamed protein product [Sphagnum balticum]
MTQLPSQLCDPDRILTTAQQNELQTTLTQALQSTHYSKGTACEQKGLTIIVYLVRKIQSLTPAKATPEELQQFTKSTALRNRADLECNKAPSHSDNDDTPSSVNNDAPRMPWSQTVYNGTLIHRRQPVGIIHNTPSTFQQPHAPPAYNMGPVAPAATGEADKPGHWGDAKDGGHDGGGGGRCSDLEIFQI